MKKSTILILFALCSIIAYSQDDAGVEKNLFKANFFTPAIEYELKISKLSTIDFHPALTGGFYFEKTAGFPARFYYALIPVLDMQFRHYYNFMNRQKKGKKISGNSGNFVGARVIGSMPPIADNVGVLGMTLSAGPMWGMHRTYKSKFNISYSIGMVIMFQEFGGKIITPMGNLTLGYVFIPKK